MICDNSVANAVGGKSARACDSCIRKRARWYCAADDAFLCEACDSLVHSANPLARRHERVRLNTASFKPSNAATVRNSVPAWHRGFTRKARTPRNGKPVNHRTPKSEEDQPARNPFPLVPEVGADETSHEENEEQLLYRVPIFDPFVAELCTATSPKDKAVACVASEAENNSSNGSESKISLSNSCGHEADSLHGFLPSDMDLAEFAADVESLLGRGLENESFGMEGLGLMDCKLEKECSLGSGGRVKLEEEEVMEVEGKACPGDDAEIDMIREPFEFSFDYDSHKTCEEEDEKVSAVGAVAAKNSGGNASVDDANKKRKILLRLDYEGVITAWASQGSPWTSGDQPDFDPDESWPECMNGSCGTELHHRYVDYGTGTVGNQAMADGGREARVSRYREKRRTRLFSKKIRYEVRKLNAEKRPRMKGRFVKRASFAGPAFPSLIAK
ncbi:zinc finger protein CONSTANS-LIKE 16 [Juglans microcarpa x Juglans regia]|uniref:zinc finger protein CONSTANS-LIKE 16 n=1 Tax=Juglans microcarpa x Juglans regia TaxID=2249226 RepID=UPI001B7DC49D|nr:zinc finger protein CONSTANS-LIKE 16 [Juglans microcarpa x Juglans regia]